MTELRIVTCDRCNPNGSIGLPGGRGWAPMSADEAIACGWEYEVGADIEGTEDTHYCIQCLEDEEVASRERQADG